MNEEYWKLRDLAKSRFIEWHLCKDKKEAEKLYDEYIDILRHASMIAPSVDEVWKHEALAQNYA